MRVICTHCHCFHVDGARCCLCGTPAHALSGDTIAALYVEYMQKQQAQVKELERLFKLEEPNEGEGT